MSEISEGLENIAGELERGKIKYIDGIDNIDIVDGDVMCMETWIRRKSCGTAFCVGGLLQMRLGLEENSIWKMFGSDQNSRLLHELFYDYPSNLDAAKVAAAIRRYLRGETPWN